MTQADLVMELKRASSRWIKERFEGMAGFAWQNGYGAFSIGQSQLAELVRYIERQQEHHRRVGFQEEYRAFLKRYGLEPDERYVWD
jgi:REP element-mobilizing transposase RayT